MIVKKEAQSEVVDAERQAELSDWLERTYEDYKQVFALTDDDFRRKKILEIGAGDRRLAAACLQKRLTGNFISLEPALRAQTEGFADREFVNGLLAELPPEVRRHLDERTVAATAEKTPFTDRSFDLVLGRSVNFENAAQLVERIKELLRVGREVRLYPVDEHNRADYEDALDAVESEMLLEYAFMTTLDANIPTASGDRRVREDVLIIRRK